jgi:hypothetical protein
MEEHLTESEHKFLRLLILCASPSRSTKLHGWLTGGDSEGNPYTFLLNKLSQKGYIKMDGKDIEILGLTGKET